MFKELADHTITLTIYIWPEWWHWRCQVVSMQCLPWVLFDALKPDRVSHNSDLWFFVIEQQSSVELDSLDSDIFLICPCVHVSDALLETTRLLQQQRNTMKVNNCQGQPSIPCEHCNQWFLQYCVAEFINTTPCSLKAKRTDKQAEDL